MTSNQIAYQTMLQDKAQRSLDRDVKRDELSEKVRHNKADVAAKRYAADRKIQGDAMKAAASVLGTFAKL